MDKGAAAKAAPFCVERRGDDSMRKLMWFTVGFAGACGMGWYFLPETGIVPCIAIFGVLTGLFWFFREKKTLIKLAVVFLGCTTGLIWFLLFQHNYLSFAKAVDETEVYTTIEASDFSYETKYGIAFEGNVELEGHSYKTRVYLNEDVFISPGDRITGDFLLRYTAARDGERSTYHSGYGIFLLGYQRDEITVQLSQNVTLRHFPAVAARRISEVLQTCFPEDTYPFAKALLLGDTSGISYELDTALSNSGIRHVVAVSGLHISILFALLSTIVLKNRYLKALIGFPLLLLFAAMAGFTPSVVRACLMSGLMTLGGLVEREYDGATSLSFAVLVMLAVNPLAIGSVSLQLSAASVAGIFLFRMRIYEWFRAKFFPKGKKEKPGKFLIAIIQSVSISLSAMVFTMLLCAVYFGSVSLIGPITNMLTLWVIAFVLYGIMAVCLMGLFWHTGAVVLANIVSVPIRYILFCADFLGSFPLSVVYTCSVYIVIWLCFLYILLAIYLIWKKPGVTVLSCCAVIGLCAALLISWWEPLSTDVSMTVLDVGQGQSILLQSVGKTILVDCGGEDDAQTADKIAEKLFSQGIARLDAVVITHCDSDHVGALQNLLTRVDTDAVLVPASDADALAQVQNVIPVKQDLYLTFGDAEMRIFTSSAEGSGNENSLCVLFEHQSCAILITGDRSGLGERLLMKRTELPQVDVLIAGHHGSADSTSESLLRTVRPEIVIISVGENNRYGHPAEGLLQRLEEFGCKVYRTDEDGTVTIRR